jgi:hypothetical protein
MAVPKITTMYPVTDDMPSIMNDDGDKGFISLFRSIRKHWIWQDAEKLKWWIDILLEVNHKPKKVLIGSKLIDCNRGQSINSLLTWAKRWRTNVSAVRRFLHLLESDSMIRIENVSKTTRITVCKYESYQDWRNDSETKMKGLRNDDETEVKTNNNANNDNKGNKGGNKKFVPPSLEEVKGYFREQGYREEVAEKAFGIYNADNWKDTKGNPIKSWKQKMHSVWFREEHKAASQSSAYRNKNSFI